VAYHVELRQFPHNMCHFNLTEEQLFATVVEPWARGQWIELGERKWSPHQAKLTVIAGPPIALDKLSMGRGWRTAQREGREVTELVLARARQESSGAEDHGQADLQADSLGLELLAAIGEKDAPLSTAWQLASTRYSEHTVGECLTLAERAVASLLRSRLVALAAAGEGGAGRALSQDEVEPALRAPDSWTAGASGIWLRRV
jgi:hypothetical protein